MEEGKGREGGGGGGRERERERVHSCAVTSFGNGKTQCVVVLHKAMGNNVIHI